MDQQQHEAEVIRRLLADEHVAVIEDVLRRDVACAVIERRMHVDAERAAER